MDGAGYLRDEFGRHPANPSDITLGAVLFAVACLVSAAVGILILNYLGLEFGFSSQNIAGVSP